MNSRAAIIGVGQTMYEHHEMNKNREETIFEAAAKSLSDAHMTREDIDSVVMCAYDLADGVAVASSTAAGAAGAHLKEETRICDGGAFGVALGCLGILGGYSDTTLVVSWCKCAGNLDVVTSLNFEPFYHRPFGLNEVTAHALQAMTFMNKYGVTERQAAKVTVKNRMNAMKNPLAHLRSEVEEDEVLKSRSLSWPLKELDLPPVSDGACAVVLASEERAERIDGAVAWISGMGWAADTYYLGNRDLAELSSLTQAAGRAYRTAGIDRPMDQIDVAEIHDVSSFHELMAYQALGFCGPGQGGSFIEEGMPFVDGKLPVNPSGGALSANPYTATGLVRVAEAALQVMGRADGHQVPGAKTALAHGASGLCGQSNCVFILSAG